MKWLVVCTIVFVIGWYWWSTRKPSRVMPERDKNTLYYLALGDSYTIGEGVGEADRWPSLLTRNLSESGIKIELLDVRARTGWTTQQLIDVVLPHLAENAPTFITIQIGVNDWVQGIDPETFRQRFGTILDAAVAQTGRADRVLVVTIPDFSAAPAGSRYGDGRDISQGIAAFNQVIIDEVNKRQVPFADVFEISQKMATDDSLVGEDGLHPSALEYEEWESIILPVAQQAIEQR